MASAAGSVKRTKRERAEDIASELATRISAVTVASTHADAGSDASTVVIGTHSGTFHCDEALACGLLLMLPAYADAVIVRSRNSDELDKCHTVVDVGAVYDPKTRRFDHHQRSFTDTMSELGFDIKLSSAGLVYRHFGKDVLQQLAPELTATQLDLVFQRTYKAFVMELDAIDNGVDMCPADVARYKISSDLSSRVSYLNPAWNEDSSATHANALFKRAVLLTSTEFVRCVKDYVNHTLPARGIVEAAYSSRTKVDASGCIIKLEPYAPWKSHLFDIEEEEEAAAAAAAGSGDKAGKPLYVLYPDANGGWRIQAVPAARVGFANRKSLPAEWRGLRDADLSKQSGIDGCVFVHTAGFIGGNKTFEGALAMAQQAVAAKDE